MKSRIASSVVALFVASAGMVVTAAPAQAHRKCFTTSSTTVNYGRTTSTYCTGTVSCEWVVTRSHREWTWRGGWKRVIDARERRCW